MGKIFKLVDEIRHYFGSFLDCPNRDRKNFKMICEKLKEKLQRTKEQLGKGQKSRILIDEETPRKPFEHNVPPSLESSYEESNTRD